MSAEVGRSERTALSIRAASQDAGDEVALVAGGEEWSFTELADRVARFAENDAVDADAEGERPRTVALWGRRCVPSLLRLYRLLDRGDTVTLLHPRWSVELAHRAISRARVEIVYDDDASRRIEAGSGPPEIARPDHGGFILFTSGTTGEPKGVLLSRRALLASADASARRLGWRSGDRWLLRLPIAHVGGLSIVTRCLAARSTVVLDSSPSFEPAAFVENVARTDTTLVSLVPTMLYRLVEAGLRAPSSVRLALIGGAPATPELLGRAADLGWPTAPTYGMTEACSQIATAGPADWGRPIEHVGRELDGMEARVVDPESGEEIEDGRAGLVQIRGAALFQGYLGEERRERGQWFSTGDWGRRNVDGNLRILARRTDMILSGGENVAPTQVEAALVAHPDIEDACVVGIEDPEWGQRVTALVVARRSARVPADETVEAFLRPRLSRFELPRRLVWVEALPTAPSGKIDRRAAVNRMVETERGP